MASIIKKRKLAEEDWKFADDIGIDWRKLLKLGIGKSFPSD